MATKAIIVEQAGGPDELEWRERETDPSPGPRELLVQTAAVGVNFIETYQRGGVYPVEYPFIPGSEASGTVLAVGDQVEGFAPGDRITTCNGVATYAETFVVPADRAVHIPEGVSFEVAAAVPLQGLTAHYLCNGSSNPQPGDTVLVHAGAGGVGLILTQLLTNRGVNVITTASTEAKREASRGAGASHALPYENFSEAVRELTDGKGVSVVYDGVGKDTFDGSVDATAVRGTVVLFGGASGQVPPFDLQRLNAAGSLFVTRPTLDHFMLTPEEREWRYGVLLTGLADGSLTFKVGATFDLADAADAHSALESRATSGKVVLLAS